MSFFGKIDFTDLTEVQKYIYHYISSNIDKISYVHVRDIARESHTSSSSVMRFIRKLGYESFTEFKTSFKTDFLKDEENETSFADGLNILAQEKFASNIEKKIQLVAQRMIEAENIVFFGIGSSGFICEYAARRLAIAGLNSVVLTDPTYPIFSKLRNTSQNMLVSLSITGETAEIVELVNGFKNNDDFTTVCITSDEQSTLANMSHYTLGYHANVKRVNKYEDLTSQIPCMYIIEYLSEEIIRLNLSE
ncbi:MurR/RpiR family transcriptional regulator [Desemzia sp. FAM 23991]|uniref:MurR/RpiR family transcriptional regulator n=1 Tax=unclassified Desemzia TaxID=2685243 RepID=UPI003888AFE2